MDRFIKQPDVSKEYPFSLTTIHRWRRDGTLTTYRQGKRRVLLLRAELDTLVSTKEKVSAGNTDEEIRNEGVNSQIQCKDKQSSLDQQNITIKYNEDGKNSISKTQNH